MNRCESILGFYLPPVENKKEVVDTTPAQKLYKNNIYDLFVVKIFILQTMSACQ